MDCSGNFTMEIDKLFPNSILKALESIGIYIEMTCNEYEKKFSTMQFFARCSSSSEKLLLFKWFNLIGIKTFERKRERMKHYSREIDVIEPLHSTGVWLLEIAVGILKTGA